jgi:transposase
MRSRRILVEFAREDRQGCPARALCTRAPQRGRRVGLPVRAQDEAAQAAQAWDGSAEGQHQYQQRAGAEGTLSQGVRGFGLRGARYRGLKNMH